MSGERGVIGSPDSHAAVGRRRVSEVESVPVTLTFNNVFIHCRVSIVGFLASAHSSTGICLKH